MSTVTSVSTTTGTRASHQGTPSAIATSAVTRSRWDLPATGGVTAASKHSRLDATPTRVRGILVMSSGATPMIGVITPEVKLAARWQADMEGRNAPLTYVDLDVLLKEGYRILNAPAECVPLRAPPCSYTTDVTLGLSQTSLHALPAEGDMKLGALNIPADMP